MGLVRATVRESRLGPKMILVVTVSILVECVGAKGPRAEAVGAGPGAALTEKVPLLTEWVAYGIADGLPSKKIMALASNEDTLYVGTEKGLVLYRGGTWKVYGKDSGLVYPVVTALAADAASGDCWVGTMGGLSRFSGGSFENFTQLNSGLANDVVYGVALQGPYVWVATTAGGSRLDTRTGGWEIYTKKNTPMHEIWCYAVSASQTKLYMAVWGGGVLVHDDQGDTWHEMRDPDGEFELDLLPDDGPATDIVATLAYGSGLLWVGTYFGGGRYDGSRWQSFYAEETGLASDFINVVAADGSTGWFGTDSGLSHYDGEAWTTYQRAPDGGGTITVRKGSGKPEVIRTTTALVDNFVTAVTRQGEMLWVGTAAGLSKGMPRERGRKAAGNDSEDRHRGTAGAR